MIISFEGIDGSGKSTQAHRILRRLAARGMEPLFVREPGGTALSEKIRDMLLEPTMEIEPLAEMLLFSAARAQLVAQQIKPHLAQGGVVICDRFFDSTVAYQGGGRGIADPDWLDAFQRVVTDGLVPDRTYLIRVPLEVAASRLQERAGADAPDRMEQAGRDFYGRVARTYDRIAERAAARVRVVDGTRSPDEIEKAIWQDLQLLLPDRN